ncbi:hypothetical protein [Blastococcus sp. Marseille-P5729]|uniref:hypothetical protein n=1 Tax=Blastococcus sp. Marseille-P5729 TaxID=2086582 RepID=UPI00351A9A19
MSLDDILAGFPVGILILLVGVTYFFGMAQVNGTIDKLVENALDRVGDRAVLIPWHRAQLRHHTPADTAVRDRVHRESLATGGPLLHVRRTPTASRPGRLRRQHRGRHPRLRHDLRHQ